MKSVSVRPSRRVAPPFLTSPFRWVILSSAIAATAPAQTVDSFLWNQNPGAATTFTWSNAVNWTPVANDDGRLFPNNPGDTADLSLVNLTGTGNTTINLGGATTVGNLQIGDSSGATRSYIIGGDAVLQTLTFDNGLSNAVLTQVTGSAANTISAAVQLNSDLDFTNFASGRNFFLTGPISGSGDINITASSLAIASTATSTASGALELTPTAVNTFTGNFNLAGGALLVTADNLWGDSSTGMRVMTLSNNAMLMNRTGYTLGGNRQIVVDATGGRLRTFSAQTFTLGTAGQLSGSGTLLQVDSGVVAINAANPGFTGTYNTSAGTLNATAAGALGTGTFISSGGATNITGAQAVTSFSVSGGTVTANDTAVYAGNATIANNPFGTGALTLTGGTTNLRANGAADATAQTLTFNNALVIGGTAVTIDARAQVAGGTNKTLAFPNTSIGSGTALTVSGANAYTLDLGPVILSAIGGGNSTIAPTTGLAVTGDVSGTAVAGLTNTLILGGTATAAGSAVSGAITDGNGGGNVAVTKSSSGTWALAGNTSNTYTGTTTVAGSGVLTLQKTSGAIAIPGALILDGSVNNSRLEIGTVATAGTIGQQFGPDTVLNFVNNTTANHVYVKLFGNNQTVAGLSEAVQDGGVVENSQTEAFSVNATLTINNANDYSYSGYLRNNSSTGTGTLSITKSGAGKQTLVGNRITYTGGTTINQGTLELSGTTGFVSPVTFGAGSTGTLQIASATQSIAALGSVDALNANAIVQNAVGTNTVLTIAQATNTTFGGLLRDNPGGNTLGLTKTGAGVLGLNSPNSYTGATTVNGGAVLLNGAETGTAGPLGVGGIITFGGGSLRYSAANTFDYSSRFSTAANQAYGIDTNGQAVTLASALTSSGGSLTKLGAGTLTLTGANTYTGNTTVAQGVLNAAGSSATAPTGDFIIGSTAGRSALNVVTSISGNRLAVGTVAGAAGAVNLGAGQTLNTVSVDNGGNNDPFTGFGAGNGAYGALNMTGGTATLSRFQVGGTSTATAAGGIGVVRISDGTIHSNGWFIIGRAGASTGVVTTTGGLINHTNALQNIYLGLSGTGRAELNVAGGLIDNTGRSVSFSGGGFTWTGTGILNMNAGTLLTNGVAYGSGTAWMNFNGGTVKAAAASATFLGGLTAAYVNGAFGTYAGGAVIDSNGNAITIAQPLLAPTGNGVGAIAVTDGGGGYIGAPAVSISGTGTGATAIANMIDDGTGNGTLKVSSITITNPGVNYTDTPTFTLNGGGFITAATPGAVGIAPNTSGGVVKNGAGVLTLSGVNTFTGASVINTGTLSLANTAAQTLAGSFSGAGTLAQSGAGTTTLAGNLSVANVNAGAGVIALTGTTVLSGTRIALNGGTVDLGGTSQSLSAFTLGGGSIINGTLSGTALLKQGNGALVLGTTVTGLSTVTVNQGFTGLAANPAALGLLSLNFAATGAPTTNILTPTAVFTLGGSATGLVGGGALSVTGANSVANSQSFASSVIDAGASAIAVTAAATPGSLLLNLGTLTRNTAGTVDITLPAGTQSSTNGVIIANPGTAGTLVTSAAGTAFATVGGSDFAAHSVDSPGNIVGASVAGAGGTSLYTAANSAATFTGNADITGSFTATSGSSVNSIRFNAGTSLTLTLAGVNTIETGGVLFGSGITTGATITGGSIRPGAGGELVFISNEAGATVSINSNIVDHAGGATSVTYRGNPNGGTTAALFQTAINHSYTGPTYITSGRVNASAAGVTAPFGNGGTVYIDGNSDGQFFTSQNVTIANPFVIIGNGLNEAGTRRGVIRLDSSATNTPTLSGPVTLVGDASIGNNATTGFSVISGDIGTSNAAGSTSFALTKILAGVVRLTGNNSQPATNINGGILSIDSDEALGPVNSVVTFTGNSSLQVHTAYTLPATRTLVVPAGIAGRFDTFGQDLTINSVISGPGTFAKSGLGRLTFTGTLHTGPIGVDQGTLAFPTDPNIPNVFAFGSASNVTTAGTLDLTGQNATFGGLIAQTNSSTAISTTSVDAGKTLTINGNVSIGSATNNAVTQLAISGAGSLVVNNPGGSVRVGVGPTATDNSSRSLFDLSGLTTFTANLGTTGSVIVGASGDNNAARVNTSTFRMAANNTISAGTLTVGGSSTGVPATLALGSGTNAFTIEIWNVGTGGRDSGVINFQAPTGTLSIANIVGGRVPLNVSTGTQTTGYEANNSIDLTGHTANLLLGAVTVGNQPRVGTVTNVISFNQGTLDMTSLAMSTRTGGTQVGSLTSTLDLGGGDVDIRNGILQLAQVTSSTSTVNGNVTVSGGTVDIGATSGVSIRMATAATGATANASLTFSGGTTTLAGDIIKGGGAGTSSATLTLSGGTLDLTGNDIGDATNAVNAIVLESGTLRNVAQINNGAAITKTTAGTLILDGTNTFTGQTNVDAGNLLVSGSITGAVAVNNTGTLGGTGTIAGAVTLSNGGVLAPGEGAGTLTTGAVLFNSTATLRMELATPGVVGVGVNDLVTVNGNLTLDGMLSVSQLAGFGEGTYRLFNYTGTLTDGIMEIDPLLLAQFPDSTISTASAGQVDLLVAIPEPASVFSIVAGCVVLLGGRRRRREV